ncbi:hypothetical protein PBI_ARISSANAE_66 [Mycobacterium phage Arissanae]|nr:hypothetical protein PBI_ARISSANAE_66 [Mycobacterium phage Arissanae]
MKRLILALVLPLIIVGLTACTTDTPNGSESPNESFGVNSNPHYVDLPDGRKVLCVYERTDYTSKSGGPSCDWDNASKPPA